MTTLVALLASGNLIWFGARSKKMHFSADVVRHDMSVYLDTAMLPSGMKVILVFRRTFDAAPALDAVCSILMSHSTSTQSASSSSEYDMIGCKLSVRGCDDGAGKVLKLLSLGMLPVSLSLSLHSSPQTLSRIFRKGVYGATAESLRARVLLNIYTVQQ